MPGRVVARLLRRSAVAALTAGVAVLPLAAQGTGDPLAVLRRWTVRDGLPQQSVTMLARDRDGFLWGATFGGLIRFDGRRIETFGLERLDVLEENQVTALAPARDGHGVWVASTSGLVTLVRDGRAVRTLPRLPAEPRSSSALLETAGGDLWATNGLALLVYRAGRWHRVAEGRLLVDSRASLVSTGGDTVLVASTRGTLRFVGTRAIPFVGGDAPLATLAASAIEHDPRRARTWFVADAVLHLREGGTLRRVARVGAGAVALTTGADGAVWIAQFDTIRRAAADGDGTTMAPVMSTAAGRWGALAVTADGVLVAGSIGDGLATFVPRILRLIGEPEGLGGREVTNVTTAPGGGVLAAVTCTDLARFDTRLRVVERIALPPDQECTRALAVDGRGRIWIGTATGSARRGLDGRWITVRGIADGVSEGAARPLLPLGGDSVVAGTPTGGLVLHTDAGPRAYPGWVRPAAAPVTALARDADGALWVGIDRRVARVTAAGTTVVGTDVGVPKAEVRAILPESTGVWVGTYGRGLVWLPRGARQARPVPLLDPTALALLRDGRGNLWVLQNRGLVVLRAGMVEPWQRDTTAPAPAPVSLTDLAEAREGNNGAPGAATLTPDLLAFASVDGFVVADASALPPLPPRPVVRVLDLRDADGREHAIGDTVVLEVGQRSLDVRIGVAAFRSPDALRFRYRLDGRDDDWIDAGTTRFVPLRDLTAGTFTLRLDAIGPDGTTASAAPIVLRIPPRWHEAITTRLLVLLALGGTIALTVRQRFVVLATRAAALQATADARRAAAEVTDRHRRELAQVGRVAVAGEMTASLMHELGQPLGAIVNNAEVARRMLARSGVAGTQVDEVLRDIAAQGERAAAVMQSLRRFLRREDGTVEEIDVRVLLDEVAALVGQEYRDHGICLDVRVAPGTPTLVGERVLLQQVLVNLLTNAADAVRQGTRREVLLRARPAGSGVRLTVADTGPGLPPPLRRTAFDAFVSDKPSGMGMGLAIARRIVVAHGGTIRIGGSARGGAVVSVHLPGTEERPHE